MSVHNIQNNDYYRVAHALKTQNIPELIECINEGIVQFDISYGTYGTILDYGLHFDNMELLGVIYLAIKKGQNFNKITAHPKKINQQFVKMIKSFEKKHKNSEKDKLEFKIAIMLDLKLIDFMAHIPNNIFAPNYKILDVALSLSSSYLFKGLVDYLLKTGLNYEEICKLISFDVSANDILFGDDTSFKITHLVKSQIPNEYIIQSWLLYKISENTLQGIVKDNMQPKIEGYTDCSTPEFVSDI